MSSAVEAPMPFVGGASFVNPPTWQGVMRQLLHLAQFSGGLQVVDGQAGSGKTVFAHRMAASLPEDVSCGVLALPAGLPTSQVFDCLLTSLGVDVKDGQSVGQSIIALRHYDSELKREQSRKILIIDDAHNFDDQALAALASVFQGGVDTEVGLALVFIGEPGTAQRLDALNLVDVEVRDCVLPALSLTDATELLSEEFAGTHAEQPFPFDDDLVCALWNESSGRPGELLRLAQAAWQEAAAAKAEAWWSKLPIWHVLALIALIAALAWGFLSQGAKERPLAPIQDAPVVEASLAAEANSSSSVAKSDAAAIAQVPPVEKVSAAEVNTTSEMEEANASSGRATSVTERAVPISVGASASEGRVQAAPKPVRAASEPQVAVQPKVAKTVKPSRPKPEIEGLTEDESELMAMAPTGYVLQVSAAKSLPALEEFVNGQRNRSSLRIYRSLRSGKSWFVVVEGYYADKDSALAAMSNLPSGQLKAGPWPKSMAAVRLEIAAYKQQSP